ncbi:MAG: hypothetical protein ABH846_00050 [Patescibacteria group bacterium]
MKNLGCLHCLKQKTQYSWSGADINVAGEIFYGSCWQIIKILEDPFKPERYPKEEVLQCEQCNAVWHIDYYFPDHPPLHVTATVIDKEQLADFFVEMGKKLSNAYTSS